MAARATTAATDTGAGATGELHAFVSYARADTAVAERIVGLLERAGRRAWLDVDDIPPSAPWREELGTAIEAASAVIFLVSRRWVASPECRREFDRARQLGKRLVHVRLEAAEGVPPELAAIQWIDSTDGDDAELLAALLAAVDTDHAWVRLHTEWLARALRWEAAGHDPSLLAHGADLRAGRAWAGDETPHDPPPTDLQLRFLAASRRHERRRRAILGGGAVCSVGVAAVLALVARGQHQDAAVQGARAESQRLAAAALGDVGEDPAGALRLAIRAQEAAGTPQAATALRQTLLAFRLRSAQRVGSRPLTRMALSPDGRRLAVADDAGRVTLADAGTGRRELTLDHGRAVGDVLRFARGGRWLLTAGADRRVRVWRVPGGRLVATLPGTAKATDADVSRSGRLAVVADGRGPARLWRLPGGAAAGALGRRVSRAALSPDGDWAVVGQRDGRVSGWSLRGRRTSRPLARSNFAIASVQTPARGAALIISDVGSAWLVHRGRSVELAGGGDTLGGRGIATGAFSPDGRLAATGTFNGSVAVWDAATGARLWLAAGHTGEVARIRFSPDGRLLATAGRTDRRDRVWDARSGQPRATLVEPADAADIAFAADSRHLFSASADGRLRTWDATGQQVWEGPGATPDVMAVGGSAAAGTLFAASRTDIFDIRDRATGALRLGPARCRVGPESCLSAGFALRLDPTTLQQTAYAPAGDTVATVAKSGRAALWDARTGAQRASLGDRAKAVLFAPDESVLAVAHDDGTVAVWSARGSVHRLRTFPTGRHAAGALAFVPGGRRLVVAADHAIGVFDASSGRRVGRERHLAAPAGALAAGRGGLLAAAQGADVALWRPGATTPVTLRGHTGAVAALAFSPDGSTLASVAADGSLRIWAVAQGAPIGTLATSAKPLEAVAFVDRAHIAAGGADGLVRLLDCDVCAPVPRLLAVARSRARIG